MGGRSSSRPGALLPRPRPDVPDRVRQYAEHGEPHPLRVARHRRGLRQGPVARALRSGALRGALSPKLSLFPLRSICGTRSGSRLRGNDDGLAACTTRNKSRKRVHCRHLVCRSDRRWIPAFAGMTMALRPAQPGIKVGSVFTVATWSAAATEDGFPPSRE